MALIFRTLDAFRVFDVVFVMKQFAPETMTVAVYARQQLIDLQLLGRGSAAAVIIFVCIFAFVILYTRLIRVEEYLAMASTTLTAGQAGMSAERIESLVIPKRKFPIAHVIGRILFWILIVFILFYTLFPFYWAVVSSLTPDSQLLTLRRCTGQERSTGATTSSSCATMTSFGRWKTPWWSRSERLQSRSSLVHSQPTPWGECNFGDGPQSSTLCSR